MDGPDRTTTLGRDETIAGLEAFVEFLKANPDAQLPHRIYVADYQRGRSRMAAKALRLGGEWQRFDQDCYHHMSRTFGLVEYSLFCLAGSPVPAGGGMTLISCGQSIVGYLLVDGTYLCDGCVDDFKHDVSDAQPIRTSDPDCADLECIECGQTRATAWNEPDPEYGVAA